MGSQCSWMRGSFECIGARGLLETPDRTGGKESVFLQLSSGSE